MCIGQLICFIMQLTSLSCKLDSYTISERFMYSFRKGKMYLRFSFKAEISLSCSFILRFMSGSLLGTTFVTMCRSLLGMALKCGFSHLGRVIQSERVLRLKDSLLRRQKKPPMASLQYLEATMSLHLFSWTKSTPLIVSIYLTTQSSTVQAGTQLRRQKAPRNEHMNSLLSIVFMASLDSLSFFILRDFSPILREKYSSDSERQLKVVSVNWIISYCFYWNSASMIGQMRMQRVRRLKCRCMQAVSFILTYRRPYNYTRPQIWSKLSLRPFFFMYAREGIVPGMSMSCYQKPINFHLESILKRLRSSADLLGSKMSCFMSSRKPILWAICTSWYLYLFLELISLTSFSQAHSACCSELMYLPSTSCAIQLPLAEYSLRIALFRLVAILGFELFQITDNQN